MCGRCCRRFRVLLTAAEVERLSRLDWGDEKDVPLDFSEKINGYPYFRRQEDGGCVFLDGNGACRMHKRFGFDRKALTCRGYPFNIVSTFPGEVSVLARMDCAGVLSDSGKSLLEQKADIEQLVSELRFGSGFTEQQLCGMTRHAVEELCSQFALILKDESLPMGDCAKLLMSLAERAEQLGGVFLSDDQTMKQVYPSLLAGLRAAVPELPKHDLGGLARALFRQWMGTYCRRDEELLKTGFVPRIKQAWNQGTLAFGWGNLRNFGREHPDFPVRNAHIFNVERGNSSREVWKTYLRFLSVRLECFQFFGVAYYGTDIFSGLRALFLTYPLVLALARIEAASRGEKEICQEDVRYAVSAMDHCHGRSPALQFSSCRSREKFLASRYSSLVHVLGEQ